MSGPPAWGALPSGLGREELVRAVGAALDRHVPHGAAVILAVSGGPDSTAMAYLVGEARPDLRAWVAHVRHGLRDDADDARIAAEHAGALGFGYHERRIHVEDAGEGPEAAARGARYRALARIARTQQAPWVLVGHTADDQAETVLLNLARGSGLRGLSGIPESRPEGDVRIVRPLLRLRRGDVRAFVQGDGLASIEDPTNADARQRRARARHNVMPIMAQLGGDPVGAVARLADLARADADALDDLAAGQARRLVTRWGPVRALPTDRLAGLPVALSTRVLRLMLGGVRGSDAGLSAHSVAAVLALAPGQAAHVPGDVLVTCGGGWLAAVRADVAPLADRPVLLPGVTELPEIGLDLHADLPWGAARADHDGQGRLDLGTLSIPLVSQVSAPPSAPIGEPPPRSVGSAPAWTVLPAVPGGLLRVRARRPGDRLRLAHGSRKLQDLLVDHGVPRAARDLVPVVVDGGDEPVWVPGVAVRRIPPDAPAFLRLWLGPRDAIGLG